jgi:hypothetical protein
MMEPVQKAILYDERNEPAYVLISYEEWLKIQPPIPRPNGAALMKYFGRKTLKGDPLEIQRKFRDEWPD